MSSKEGYFLGPLIIREGEDTGSRVPRVTNEQILHERAYYYIDCWKEMRLRAEELKAQYGSWGKIPNKLRTNLANNLRYAGFIYNPVSGWSGPNSVALSSI